MKNSILVVAPNAIFCEQLRSNLEEGGRYSVQTACTSREAFHLVNHRYFDLVILDSELSDIPLQQFIQSLNQVQPGVKLLLYPPENDPNHPATLGIAVNGYLRKPFFAPELSQKLKELLKPDYESRQASVVNEGGTANIWLQNPDQFRSLMEELLAHTSAYSAMVCVKGQSVLECGNITPGVVQNVTLFLNHYWSSFENHEIFRYMRMEADTSVYLIYSQPLNAGVSIVLLFPPAIQIRQVRSEARRLRDDFIERRINLHEFTTSHQPRSSAKQASDLDTSLEEWIEEGSAVTLEDILGESEISNINQLLADMPMPDPEAAETEIPPLQPFSMNGWMPIPAAEPAPGLAEDATPPMGEITPPPLEPAEPAGLSPVETVIPSVEVPPELPIQAGTPPVAEESLLEPESAGEESVMPGDVPPDILTTEVPAAQEENSLPGVTPPLPAELHPTEDMEPPAPLPAVPAPIEFIQAEVSAEEQPPVPAIPAIEQEPTQAEQSIADLLGSAFSLPWDNPETSAVENTAPFTENQADGIQAAAKPFSSPAEDQLIPPVIASQVLFNYACLILPRDTRTFLVRELAAQLSTLIPEIHLRKVWKLVSLAVRPQYLLWTVSLPLSISPRELIEVVKAETEAYLRQDFPELFLYIQQQSFWAPGYFALSGEISPTRNLIQAFQTLCHPELQGSSGG